MKNGALLKFAKLFGILLILLTFIVLFVFCVFLPRTDYSEYDTLTEKPAFTFAGLLDGSFTAQYADYFSDSVHSRDWFKAAYGQLRLWFGTDTLGGDEIVFGEQDDPFQLEVSSEPENPGTTTSSEPEYSGAESSQPNVEDPDISEPNVSEPDVSEPDVSEPDVSEPERPTMDAELENSLVLLGDRVMEVYNADKNLKYLPRFADALNSFAASMDGVNVYSMVIPKAAAYYIQNSSKYGHTAGNTLHDLQALSGLYSDRVHEVNIYDTLKAHANEHIYFHTDHHWTALGAYYAAQKFASDLQLPFADLSTFEVENRQGFLGTMYTYSKQDARVAKLKEEFSIYRPTSSYTSQYYNQNFENPVSHDILFNVSMEKNSSWYMMFINGDAYSWKIQSNTCKNGRKLLVVKDSYGNAMVPFLVSSFEEVYVVDARVFQRNLKSFVSEQGITDVLFAECAFSARGNAYIQAIEGLTK